MKQKIALIGYGVIGKRIVEAIALQNDMELSGVCEVINLFVWL
jgi:glyceraldehyde-3-phosphate dehydrogenase (NAD(P))